MRKRLLSALLAMAMVLTMLPMSAFAANDAAAVFAGLSTNKDAAIATIKDVAKVDPTAAFGEEKATDLLWFVLTGFDAGKYSLSMTNADGTEVLTDNAISYGKPDENHVVTVESSGKYLVYVSLNEAAEDKSGQVDPAALGKGEGNTEFKVTVKAMNDTTVGDKVAETTITLKKEEDKWVQVKAPAPGVTVEAVAANLTAVADEEAPAYGHATKYEVGFNETTATQIDITATGLEKTENAATPAVTDYWVGVGLTKQTGATYAWGFGAKPADLANTAYKTVDREQTVGTGEQAKTYTTLYWSSDDTDTPWSETTGYVSVKVDGVVTADYTVTFNVAVKSETPPAAKTAKITAGVSATGTDVTADVAEKLPEITGAKVADSDKAAKNILWFVVEDLTVGNKYSLSVKNGEKEVLTKYAISYTDTENVKRAFTATAEKQLFYVSLDEAGANGQVDATALGEGTNETTLVASISPITDDVIGTASDSDTIKVQKANETWAEVSAPAQKTPITVVNVKMDTTAIKVGDELPAVTVETTPADGAEVAVDWKLENEPVDKDAATTKAGTYVATFTVTPKADFELAENVVYKVNGTEVADAEALKANLTVEAVEAAVITEFGFEMDAADADTELDIAPEAPDADHCDDMTMWAKVSGLAAGAQKVTYKITFTDPAGKEVYSHTQEIPAGTENAAGPVYFTFDQTQDDETHSVSSEALTNGKYKVTLEKVGTTYKKEAELEIFKVTLNPGEEGQFAQGVKDEIFAVMDKELVIPTPELKTGVTGYSPIGWNVTLTAGKYVVKGNAELKFTWKNDLVEAGSATVEKPADADATITDEVVTAVGTGTDLDAASTVLVTDTAAVEKANEVAKTVDEDTLTDELKAEGYDGVKVIVYLEVAPKSLDTTDAENKTLTVEVTPMVKMVAAKAGTADEEKVIGTPEKIEGVSESVVMTIGLPTGFAEDDDTLYVTHKEIYVYSGTVADDAVTFTNPHGFSEFVISAANPTKAILNGVNYTSLQEAINTLAKDADVTIQVSDGVTAAKVDKAMKVKLESTGSPAVTITTDLLTVKDGVNLTKSFDEATGTFTFTEPVPDYVAKIGEQGYTSLADAIKAAQAGDTIVIQRPLTDAEKAVTVELSADKAVKFQLKDAADADVKITINGKEVTIPKEGTASSEITIEKKPTSTSGPFGGPSGGGTTTYSVNVPTTANGTVTVNPRNAAKDATVTITVAPNQGYHLDTLTVTDKDGNTIELTKVDSNKYTFKMPASRVEIKATFVEGEAPAISFTDVVEGEYYVDAVKWAVDKGITNGLTDTTFGPNASCTRAQMVTFLWRAAGSPEPTTTTTAFTDVDSNEYYYKAMLWAVEKGITKGTTDTTFAPNATVTRAQTVTFLYRYAGSPAVNGTNAFTDLEAGEYYVDAVQWAATNGITTGTTETTFSPANNCTRGQIVTFLYRHIVK